MLVAAEQCFFEGNRHLAARDYASAQACYRQAVSIAPRFAEAHANLGWLLTEIDACDEADACYRRALAIDPSQVQISLNYGALLARLKRFGEAEAIYLRAVELAPQSAHTWSNLGVLYAQMARFKESEACCRRSMLLDPNYAKARINLSYLCLRQGRFEEGWEHYESRSWRCALETHVDCPRWAGESLEGCSLLVGNEGGFGDMIQFSRYAAVLKRQGARRITLVSPPALQALFASLDGADEVLSCDEPISSSGWDFWTPLMSAPYHCGTRMGSIPAGLPYLRADSRAVARWRPSLPE